MPPGNAGCAKTSTPLSSGGSTLPVPVPPPMAVPSDAVPAGGTSSSSSSSSGSEDATTEKTLSPQKADAATAATTQASSKTKKVWTFMKQKTVLSHAMHEMLLDCMA